MELEELASTKVSQPGGSGELSIMQLADDWAKYVLRLEGERIEVGSDLAGIKEFVAGLMVRDRLEKGLNPDAGDTAPPALVLAVDALYRGCTHKDDHRVLVLLDEDLPTRPWWWERIPASGPLASEFSKQARRLR